MLKVMRTEKGASILNLEELVKVNIEEDVIFDCKSGYGYIDCYQVEFDTRLFDLLRGSGSTWFVKSLDFDKQNYPELAEILGNLLGKGREHIIRNRPTGIFNEDETKYEAQHRYLYENAEEIIYFSEDSYGDQVPRLELMKVEDRGYSLSFRKATSGLAKLDFFVRRNHGRDPELAKFYCQCFSEIIDLAEPEYDYYDNKMMELFLERKKLKIEEKKLVKKIGK